MTVQAKGMDDWMNVIQGLWRKLGHPGEFFMQGAIHKEKSLPFVSYRTVKRVRDAKVDGMRSSRIEGHIPHPHIPGEFVELRTKRFIKLIEFEVQAKTSGEAEDLMERLEDLLEDYKDQLAQIGVSHIEFMEQGEDEFSSEAADTYAKRRLYYQFRYTKTRHVNVSDIESAYVSARVQDNKGG